MIRTCWSVLPTSRLLQPSLTGLKRGHSTTTFDSNPSKTREMVIYRNKPSFDPLGSSTPAGAERVGSMRALGVEIGANLSVGAHLNVILSNSASSIHALRMLHTHGLSQQQFQEVARVTTLASLLFASPAWWGITTIRDRDRLERLVGRLRRGGISQRMPPLLRKWSSLLKSGCFEQ